MMSTDMKRIMPTVYRTLITASGITYIVSGFVLKAPYLVLGIIGQTIIIVAGVSMLGAAWTPAWKQNRITAYLAGVATALLVYTAFFLNYYPAKISAIVVWTAVGLYTVGLLAFGWIREPPE